MYYKCCNLQSYEVVFEFHANIHKNNLVKMQYFQEISMQLDLAFNSIFTLCNIDSIRFRNPLFHVHGICYVTN